MQAVAGSAEDKLPHYYITSMINLSTSILTRTDVSKALRSSDIRSL